MGFKKFIKNVQEIFSSETERTESSRDRIEELLGELEQKEKKLNHKLSKEEDSKKRKDLKRKSRIDLYRSGDMRQMKATTHDLYLASEEKQFHIKVKNT